MSLSIIIPCHNEEEIIEETVNHLNRSLKNINFEIILINDFSYDKTWIKFKNLSKIYKNLVNLPSSSFL